MVLYVYATFSFYAGAKSAGFSVLLSGCSDIPHTSPPGPHSRQAKPYLLLFVMG